MPPLYCVLTMYTFCISLYHIISLLWCIYIYICTSPHVYVMVVCVHMHFVLLYVNKIMYYVWSLYVYTCMCGCVAWCVWQEVGGGDKGPPVSPTFLSCQFLLETHC